MNRAARIAAWSVLLALAALTAWRIVATAISDRLALESPAQALQWDSRNPRALLALARLQLEQDDPAAARETALRLLGREPLSGEAFELLGKAAETQADRGAATRLSDIALRRSPHALGPPAWLVGEQLEQASYAEALENVDRILRVAPKQSQNLFPILVALAEKPEFADALAGELASRPRWRGGFINTVLIKATPQATERIMVALQRRDSLDSSELGRWLDRLVKDGQWGEAYARWAGEQVSADVDELSIVYNGGFETAPSGIGFDWRLGDSAAVIIDRADTDESGGSTALRLRFLGRRAESIPLHQWLLLSAGNYRLRFRASGQDLRSDRGLQWTIRCHQARHALAASEPLTGSFDWNAHSIDFAVPEQDCPAQDLSLDNAGAEGAGKIVLGTLWFDDLTVERIDR